MISPGAGCKNPCIDFVRFSHGAKTFVCAILDGIHIFCVFLSHVTRQNTRKTKQNWNGFLVCSFGVTAVLRLNGSIWFFFSLLHRSRCRRRCSMRTLAILDRRYFRCYIFQCDRFPSSFHRYRGRVPMPMSNEMTNKEYTESCSTEKAKKKIKTSNERDGRRQNKSPTQNWILRSLAAGE